jgi:hypothetical protein
VQYPSGLTMITVAGSIAGTPEAHAEVTIRSTQWLRGPAADQLVAPFTLWAIVDTDGDYSVQLPATDDPAWDPARWSYEVTLRWGSNEVTGSLEVPMATEGVLQLADALALNQPVDPGVVTYLTAADKGAPGGLATLGADGRVPAAQLPPGGGGDGGDGPVTSVNGRIGAVVLTGADVGLGNVANTTDAGKPISSAAAAALALKAPLASPAFSGTVTGVTKAMVGLGSVDNTTDAGKPVSTAAAAALATKADAAATAAALVDLDGRVDGLEAAAPTTAAALSALDGRVTAVEGMIPVFMVWDGSAYVEAPDARVYVGPVDPGAVVDGSDWIDTSA